MPKFLNNTGLQRVINKIKQLYPTSIASTGSTDNSKIGTFTYTTYNSLGEETTTTVDTGANKVTVATGDDSGTIKVTTNGTATNVNVKDVVTTDSDQTIAGTKTFSNNVVISATPTADTHAATVKYVNDTYVKNGMNDNTVIVKSETETGIRASEIIEVQVGHDEWTELEEIFGEVNITKTGEDTATITIEGTEIDLKTLALKWIDRNGQQQPIGGGVLTRNATTGEITVSDTYANKSYVDSKIAESDAMQYRGSLNQASDLPTVSNTTNNVKVGATYKVATAGTYSYYNGTSTVSQSAKVGDLFIAQAIASGTTKTITWDYIPAADDVLALSYITSGTPTISTTAQTGTSLTLGSVVTKMVETTLTNTDANVPTSKAVQTYVSGGYIPNAGNTQGISFNFIRDNISFVGVESFDVDVSNASNNENRITIDADGVNIESDNANTSIKVGYADVDNIDIAAEDGAVTFVTDNINLQAVNTTININSTSSVDISTDNITFRCADGFYIESPNTNVVALEFGTDFDTRIYNNRATLIVHGDSITAWNNFVSKILANNGGITNFIFDITNKTINVTSNITIENGSDESDYENILKFVNCTFNITNGNAVISINGGRVEFENCMFVAPSYVSNQVRVTGIAYAVFKNCTFENVDVGGINNSSSVFIVENCYCSHNLNLTPTANPTAPIKIMNSYFDTATITTPTGQTDVNAIIASCRFSSNTSLSNVRRSWNNTLY